MSNGDTGRPAVLQSGAFKAVARRFEGHVETAEKIATDLVERYPEASLDAVCRSVDVALETISRGVVKAFLSFKMTDQGKRAARVITEQFEALTANKLDVTSALDFPTGVEWPRLIRRELNAANWFILLLPEKSKAYDWMLFETGMFRAQMSLVDRLICLHHPQVEIADQIREFQAVEATKEGIRPVLSKLIIEPNAVPGMPALNPGGEPFLDDVATSIAASIDPPIPEVERTYHGRVLTIHVPEADQCDCRRIREAEITKCTRVERIFDRSRCPRRFGELVEDVVNFDDPDPWLLELCETIRRGATGRTIKPIQATLVGAEFGRVFRPILHATDRFDEDRIGEVFHIVFLEDDRVMSTAKLPVPVGVIAALVRQAFRFHWEIVRQFTERELQPNDCDSLEDVISSLEADFGAAGFSPQQVEQAIRDQFGADDRDRILAMHGMWRELRNEEGAGRLDVALRDRDITAIRQILSDLAEVVDDYLAILTRRFHDMSLQMTDNPGGEA